MADRRQEAQSSSLSPLPSIISTTTSSSNSSDNTISPNNAPNFLASSTTEQLNGIIRRINPFDENFREANKTMMQVDNIKDTEIEPSKLQTFSINKTTNSIAGCSINNDYLTDISFSSPICSITSISGSSSVLNTPTDVLTKNINVNSSNNSSNCQQNQQRHLSLKLPSSVGGLCAGSDLTSIQTPDLSTLINQVITNSSPLLSAPQTADVLKTALDIREMAEMRRNSHSGLLKVTAPTVPAAAPSAVQYVVTKLKVPQENSPRIIVEEEEVSRTNQSPAEETTIAPAAVYPSSPPGIESSNNSLFYVPLRVGDQIVYIPVNPMGNVNSTVKSSTTEAPKMLPGTVTTTETGSRLDELPTVVTLPNVQQQLYGNAVCSSDRDVSLSCSPCPKVEPNTVYRTYDRNSILECSASPASSIADDEKRKESLERNKEAAWRYRKRKKEEKWLLEERAKILENEKAELMAQVAILKSDLTRVNQVLNEHKHCTVGASSKK